MSYHEVELAPLALIRIVESVTPVNTQQTDHREEHADTHTGGTLDLERIEFLYVRPAITTFHEEQGEDRRLRLEDDRIAGLNSELVVNITGIIAVGVVRSDLPRSEGIVLISTKRDDVGTIGVITRHTVSTNSESLKRGISPLPVVVTKVTKLGSAHDHEILHDLCVGLGTELPLVILMSL